MKDGEVEKRKGRKSERKWLIKKVERWKMTSFVSPKIAVMHRSMYVYTHSTSLSADSGYFSLNTAVLSDWAIAMVIRKMWSEQQAFERWSLLHTNTHTQLRFFVSHTCYTIIIVLSHQHTHYPVVLSHTNADRTNQQYLHTPIHWQHQGHFLQIHNKYTHNRLSHSQSHLAATHAPTQTHSYFTTVIYHLACG